MVDCYNLNMEEKKLKASIVEYPLFQISVVQYNVEKTDFSLEYWCSSMKREKNNSCILEHYSLEYLTSL